MQPIIGITAGRDKSDTNIQKISLIEKYTTSIINSGGIPVIIPSGIPGSAIKNLVHELDGILITGGPDLETKRFNGIDHPRVYGVDIDRDQLEIDLVNLASRSRKPLLGICRGIQVINVAFGGDLFTDIHDQVSGSLRHDWFPDYPRDLLAHEIQIKSQSLLHEILQIDKMEVNSLHHQAIRTVAKDLEPVASAMDGIIEAVEYHEHPFLIGVQWHPEWLFHLESTKLLFNAFINRASQNE